MDGLMARYELLDEIDLPFPLELLWVLGLRLEKLRGAGVAAPRG
jgi:hypothetical protein